jgi:diacylglycerol kinase
MPENSGKAVGMIKKQNLKRKTPNKIIKSKGWRDTFKHALEGCWWAFQTQKNFKVHLTLSLLVLLLALWLKIGNGKMLLLILAVTWGLTIEMANTAFEKTVDLITEKYHLDAKIIKDVSAGMMLIMAIGLALLGLIIILPPLIVKLIP